MSNDALNWAWKSGLAPQPRFVLVALADCGNDHSGEDWSCFPSIAKLAEMTGYSMASLTRHLAALEGDGWITKRRRRRADGSLGLYDFVLHRDRMELGPPGVVAAAKQAADQGLGGLSTTGDQSSECGVVGAGDGAGQGGGDAGPEQEKNPQSDQGVDGASAGFDQSAFCGVAGGGEPSLNLSITTPQNGVSPPLNLRGQERTPKGTLIGTLKGAREPGDARFEEAAGAYPQSGLARTDWPMARAAFALQAEMAGGVDPLISAIRRYAAEDQGLRSGDFGAAGLHVWLAKERWRAWVSEAQPVAAAAPEAARFEGPDEVLDAVAEAMGEAKAAKRLASAAWDGEARRIVVGSTFIASELRAAARHLSKIGVTVSVGERA